MKETKINEFHLLNEEELSKINGGKRKNNILGQILEKIIFSNRSISPVNQCK